MRANFFIVKNDNAIVTPETEILKGITRKQTLELAQPFYQIERRPLLLEELATAKEAFIASSTKQIMPVVQLDNIGIGNGRPGAVSQHLLTLLKEKEAAYLSSFATM